MSQSWSPQSNDDPDDTDAWMARRNTQLALRLGADSIARDLWNQSTRDGGDLYAGNPSDLSAIGLAAQGGEPYSKAAANDDYPGSDDGGFASSAPSSYANNTGSLRGFPILGNQGRDPNPSLPNETNAPLVSELEVVGRQTPPDSGFLDRLNHNPFARFAAGVVGYGIGLPVGAIRSGGHAIKGVEDGLSFARSLLSPEGRTAALNEARSATHAALQYGRSAFSDPSRVASDVVSVGKAAIHDVVPMSMADTVKGEFDHELGLGTNAGEALTNIVGAVALPEVYEGINAARTFAATRDANIAKFVGQGFGEDTARYLSKRYDGMGDHALISKSQNAVFGVKTPLLKKAPIPGWLKDSPLNVSRPRGMSQGDFYEYHYGVDPQFYGARLPRDLNGGKGWSGKRLRAERYSGVEQLWKRTPQIWKDYPAGTTLGDSLRLLPGNDPETPR